MKKLCLDCNKEFVTYPSRIKKGLGKYCSRECSDKYTLIKTGQKISPTTQFKKGNIPPFKGKKMSLDFRQKLSKAHIGVQAKEKHPAWQGGISEQKYPGAFNKLLKELILVRDSGDCCQGCGRSPEICGKLQIHHIDFVKNNLDHDNLISLCPRCNVRANYDRENTTKYYKERVASQHFYSHST